eukprot:tig00021047_g18132.t1
MTSVAGIVEYIARTEAPTPPPPSAPTSRTAGWTRPRRLRLLCRLYSYKLGGPALEAIAIPVAQFKDPAPDVGPFLVKPHTKGKGKRTRNSAPAFLPPQPPPRPPAAPRPAAHRRDAAAPGYPTNGGAGPSGYGSSASSASADGPSPSRPRRHRRAEASERWRAFEAESAGLAKGLGYSYRRVPVLKDYASAAAREASRAEIDAAEEQAAREEAEDNARFRHLHH